MSNYLNELFSCRKDDERLVELLEKSIYKLLMDALLVFVLTYLFSGVLKSSAAALPETSTISTGAVIGLYTVIYAGFAVSFYLIIKHSLPLFFFCQNIVLKLFKYTKSKLFVKKREIQTEKAQESINDRGEDEKEFCNHSNEVEKVEEELSNYSNEVEKAEEELSNYSNEREKAEEELWNYLNKFKYKYIYGFAFQWLSCNGNLGGMSQDEFIVYIKSKTNKKVSTGTISSNYNIAFKCSCNICKNKGKQTQYDNMADLFNSLLKKNELLHGLLKK